MGYEISKSDWKLFRTKLADWQEAYMGKLTREYIEILSTDEKNSEKFRKLDERIRKDKKSPGVQISPKKSNVIYDLLEMIEDGVIDQGDLTDFSEDLQETVGFLVERRYGGSVD